MAGCDILVVVAGSKVLVIFRKKMAGLSKSTLERFLLRARRAAGLRGTLNVLVTNNHEVRSLNRRFRGIDKATDVLSFPAADAKHALGIRSAGEIAISAAIARDNAQRLGHTIADEIKILVLHGILHLAGYDHEHDSGEMARKENALRRELGLDQSLIERTEAPARKVAARHFPRSARRRIA
jgi:probable rRNA maturation factor